MLNTEVDKKLKNKLVHRDTATISVRMVEAAVDGISRTDLMKEASLSFTQLNKYTQMLLDLGYIQGFVQKIGENRERTVYKITPKGLDFLKDVRPIARYLKELYNYKASKW